MGASESLERFERHRVAVRARLRAAVAAGEARRAGPGSVSWRINREIVVVIGWGRAILLQLAHPLVAAGVADHSMFRGDRLAGFRRLFSTVRAMLALTFGDEEDAVAAAAAINVIHDRVAGTLGEAAGPFAAGTAYSAHDPELLRWVHATLLDSLPRAYELFVGPLEPGDRDRYGAEGLVMAPLLDIPGGLLPASAGALDRYMQQMLAAGPIHVGGQARALARGVLHPPLSGALWPAFRPVRLATIGLLPGPLREAYGFRWSAREAGALKRWALAIRSGRRMLPRALREWPSARRAARLDRASRSWCLELGAWWALGAWVLVRSA
jgi:uncharacterized protein (DUF2236 family)